MPEFLSQSQIDQVTVYLVIPSFLAPGETQELLQRSKDLLDDFDPATHPLTKFTTGDDDHVGDDYFLDSGDKIRYFLETDALDKDGKLNREKQKAVNKIGHGLHELDPAFRRVTLENDRLRSLVRDLKFHHDPVALQSMYTDPPSALGCWIALEKCTALNGALSFLPGSHKTTPITKRFVRLGPGKGTGFEALVSPAEEKAVQERSAQDAGKYVMETCEPGDLVLIHGSVLHKSERNTSPNTRFAYTFHLIESEPYAKYDEKNWLQPTKEMPFSRILPQGEINEF
ncbi:phytanoyl-CoA dioxygenase [Ephemerocybe angulata]|uniref:Phytanoyl-CoA dioxygenase n=1 Tax=Ephemerocybe angulata TaxID=980116 RepID=A0A8H6ICW6_9AGAR|nr:phytanoyl-CoA dioxygenase [Tulosesus angulatus]